MDETLENSDLSSELSQDLSGADEANLSESGEQPTNQEILDWAKDKRSAENGMWYDPQNKAACPNKMYGSYKSLEKEYTPIKQAISKYGFKDSDSLGSALEEYQKLKDPNNEINSFYNNINSLASHEKYGQKFNEFFDGLQKEIQLESLPPEYRNLPEAYRNEYLQLKNKVDRIEQDKAQQQQTEQFNQSVAQLEQTMQGSLSGIEKLAQEHNLDFDVAEFLTYVEQNKVQPEYWEDRFLKMSMPQIIERAKKAEGQNVLTNVNRNNRAGILSSQKAQPTGMPNFGSKVKDILSKSGIT